MKKVFDTNEIPHLWVHQKQEEARNAGGNLFFNKEIIYSYGHHFPIARLHNGTVFFTTQTYSKTTAKHLSAVRSACNHLPTLYMYKVIEREVSPTNWEHADNIAHFIAELKTLIMQLKNARKKEKYISKIDIIKARLTTYCDYFKVKLTKEQNQLLENLHPEGLTEYLQKESARIEKEARANIAKRKKQHTEEVAKFKAFETESAMIYTRFDRDYLRYNKEQKRVETSQGIQTPVETARKFYKLLTAKIARGGCMDCPETFMDYPVKEISAEKLVIGCHAIYMDEITAFAKFMQW